MIQVYRIYSINRPGRLLNFWTLRVGAYSRWALIRGWALIRINTVVVQQQNKTRFAISTSSVTFLVLVFELLLVPSVVSLFHFSTKKKEKQRNQPFGLSLIPSILEVPYLTG